MKKILAILLVVALSVCIFTACDEYDDTELRNRISQLEQELAVAQGGAYDDSALLARIAELEQELDRINSVVYDDSVLLTRIFQLEQEIAKLKQISPGTIFYRLDGGTNHEDNPEKYTVEQLPLTINKPTKKGYYFSGWTVLGNTEKQIAVTIENFEFVVLTANWTTDESIIYGNGKKLAPDFTLKDLDGNDVKLSQFRGETAVMITFFSYDCPNSKKDIEDIFIPNKDAFGDDVEFLLVHSAHEKDGGNGTAKLRELIANKKTDGIDYRQLKIVLDPDFLVIAGLYGSATVPNTFMVDKWGYLFKEDRDASNTVVAFSHSRVSKFTDFSRIINGAITRGMGY